MLVYYLDTGPGTSKSSTLCSLLLLLLVIATFLVCEVPGQMKEELVGVANHKKIGNKVTLVNHTIIANEENFNSFVYIQRFPNSCEAYIDKNTIEFNIDGKACTMDLLSRNKSNNNRIKFKAGVRNKGGQCFGDGSKVQDSFNNTMPFVYSKNNKDVERLSKGPIYTHEEICKKKEACGLCMPWTILEVSWTRTDYYYYAFTRLGKIKLEQTCLYCIFVLSVGEVTPGKKDKAESDGSEDKTIDIEIESDHRFTMLFGGNLTHEQTFDSSVLPLTVDKIKCVPRNTPFVAPETWTITNDNLEGERLLVFSLLPASASVVLSGKKLVGTPARQKCHLFVQFERPDYELLFVSPPPPTTTTVTTTPEPETTTSAPCECPTTSSETATATTTSAPSAETKSSTSPVWGFLFILLLVGWIVINAGWICFNMKKDENELREEKMPRSIVITTGDSEYGSEVNTAIQVDAESAETAREDGESTRPQSVVITTGDSEYGPNVNTAIQVGVESAKTAQEDGKSTTAPVNVGQAQSANTAREDEKSVTAEVDVGQTQEDDGETEGSDNETVTPVETETLPELEE
ncbi:unnamed protein product [Meloidogyne enterolobii]|uniref:Uncharacterized protein n=1 Tax=Meloidogyne enterolobii TaxID=390850 RepID=A0ACB0Z7D7_MELEN